ncbi:MAG: LLM class flavin-dependent oxidoreductase [Rubrobacter sp.]|nr:LLM class flavin-dependent oxidoreductase [Rubrobacter sp.]
MNQRHPTFGLWYDFRQQTPLSQDYESFYQECLDEIVEGESLGFSNVWLSEHHFVDDGYLPSPLTVAAGIAGRTSRIGIGTNILLLPLHDPLRVAEDAAAVDLVSAGRFTLGVAAGYIPHEFEMFGNSMKNRPSLVEEGVEILRRALEDGRTGYEGKRHSYRDLPFEPRPKRGGLPIYFGAVSEPAIDRAARLGDGFLTGPGDPAWLRETYRASLESHGRNPDDYPFNISTSVFVHEDSDYAWKIQSEHLAYRESRYAEWATPPGEELPEPMSPEDFDRDTSPAGTPEEVIEKLVELHRRAPYDHLCFWGRPPTATHEEALTSMRRFASEVGPKVQGAVSKD